MDNDYYETSDLGLAASLSAIGFHIDHVNKDNPRRVIFAFTRSHELLKTVDKYWSGNLLLSAMSLLEHIKQLKGRLYS